MAIRNLILHLFAACSLCACAAGPDPRDPMEPFNRKVYTFNDALDKAVLKPAAKGYVAVVPKIARRGVTNFFNNLGMVITTLNDALQLKGTKVPVDVARIMTNTVFGLGGLIDVATELKIEYRNEDFGQTMGYWGVPSGPYVMLPFFGPSDVRDAPGLAVDFVASPFFYWNPEPEIRWGLFALDIVDTRASLLSAEKFIDTSGVDRYSFLRDTYLQRREYLIYDGNPPAGNSHQKTLKELEDEDALDDPVPLRAAPRPRRP